ncbi:MULTISPECIES: hypothetical protein [Halobacterium]|uniref:DUF7537 family lipoprotein n=1 Tax=Halobacterium TaxID=2239 RepID=UPI00073EA1B2|nr:MULTISPECIES: hypothetical protein [Halobacterium]MCG1003392.1 hypothetical protein [Halobacterium noricense]
MSNRVAALAVVVLVLLAGCSGGLSGGDGSTDGASSDLPPVAEQSWANDNETVDYERLQEQHANALSNATSYEYTQGSATEDGVESNTRLAVDREASTVLLETSTARDQSERVQHTYVADGVAYSQSGTDGDYQYSSQNVTDEQFQRLVTQTSQLRTTGGVFDALNFEYAGTEDGAYRFEADDIASSEETSFNASNVVESSATLVVDEDGYVRTLSLTLTVDQGDGERTASLEFSTSGVNETSVEEPSWTDEAA